MGPWDHGTKDLRACKVKNARRTGKGRRVDRYKMIDDGRSGRLKSESRNPNTERNPKPEIQTPKGDLTAKYGKFGTGTGADVAAWEGERFSRRAVPGGRRSAFFAYFAWFAVSNAFFYPWNPPVLCSRTAEGGCHPWFVFLQFAPGSPLLFSGCHPSNASLTYNL